MVTLTSLAETAALVGDPARAAILYALLDGRAFTAGELSRVAGVTAPTASGHLTKLTETGMLKVERQGRHRYFRLASSEVGAILEGLLLVTEHRTAALKPKLARPGPRDAALRRARVCYDHLAGELGVKLFEVLLKRQALRLTSQGAALTAVGEAVIDRLGMSLAGASERGLPTCRPCLDWSERRHHLAGTVGKVLLATALERGWLRRLTGTRALEVTHVGATAFRSEFDIKLS